MATDETRARIIEAAGPIFAEKNYRDATVREICEAAGVALASINYHFRDKQQLYIQVVESAFEKLDRFNQERLPRKEWPPGTPVETRLRGWVDRMTQKLIALPRDSWQDRLLTREVLAPTEGCEDLLRTRIDAEMAPLFAILDEVLAPEAMSGRRWRIALSIVGQILIYDSHRGLVQLMLADEPGVSAFEPSEIADHVTRLSLAALGLDSARGNPPTEREA